MAKNIESMKNAINVIKSQILDGTLDTIQACPETVTSIGTLHSLSKALWTHAQLSLGYKPSGTWEYFQNAWFDVTLDYVQARWTKDRIIAEIIPLADAQQLKEKERDGVYLTQTGRWAKLLKIRYVGSIEPDLITSVKIKKYNDMLVNKHVTTGGIHIWEKEGKPVMSLEEAKKRLSDAEPKPTKKGKKKVSE